MMHVQCSPAAADFPRPLLGYALATLLVAVCTLGRTLLSPILEGQGVYLAYMIPVALSGYLAGRGPGALSIVLSAIAASPLFRPPLLVDRAAVAHLVLFVGESVAVLALFRRLQRNDTALRTALDQAESARRAAEEANHAREELVARVSHEWRSPLNTISGWLWQMQRQPDNVVLVRRASASMKRSIDVLSRLASDLLDFSRGAHGKLSIRPERLNLVDLVRRSIEAVAPEARAKQIAIAHDGDGRCASIRGDAVRLGQVFTNVLTNAVKFTPPGGHVTVTLARLDDEIEVSVRDTGRGIRPEALATIFDAFAQSDERRDTARGGLGLGLSIARQIVDLHGGSMWATSDGPACGSTFHVRLPAMEITAQGRRGSRRVDHEVEPAVRGGRRE